MFLVLEPQRTQRNTEETKSLPLINADERGFEKKKNLPRRHGDTEKKRVIVSS